MRLADGLEEARNSKSFYVFLTITRWYLKVVEVLRWPMKNRSLCWPPTFAGALGLPRRLLADRCVVTRRRSEVRGCRPRP